jgi:exopolysaccharide production protein ExoQ
MPPLIATLVYAFGIWGLFRLDRDPKARTSKALWIPVLWLLINGSRPVSSWLAIAGLGEARRADLADQLLDGSPVDRFVFTILLAVGLMVLISRKRQVGALLRRNGPILLFFAYCGVSVLWSDYTFVAFKRWTRAVGDVVMVLVVLSDPDRSSAVKRLLTRVGFVLVPLSVLLIKYYPDVGRGYDPWSWVPTYGGVTTNKNELGMTCLVLGLGSVWCFLAAHRDQKSKERTRRLIAHGTVVAMVIWLLWMANSMTSLSCFIMAGGLIAMTSLVRWARKPKVVHFFVAAVVCVCFSVLFLNVGGGALETLGRDPTLTGRTEIWNIVLGLVRNPLVGTGFESFWLGDRLRKVWEGFGLHIQEAHNGYLEVFLNLGWIGVTLLAVLIVTGYRNAVAAFRRDRDTGSLKLAYFVAAVAYNFTESAFGGACIWIAFLLAIVAVPQRAASTPIRDHADTYPECEPRRFDHMLPAGFSPGEDRSHSMQVARSHPLRTEASQVAMSPRASGSRCLPLPWG